MKPRGLAQSIPFRDFVHVRSQILRQPIVRVQDDDNLLLRGICRRVPLGDDIALVQWAVPPGVNVPLRSERGELLDEVVRLRRGHETRVGAAVTKLWKEVCEKNCDFELDLCAVPYFVHRDDLALIAPLWKYYSLKLKETAETDKALEQRYSGIQFGWGAEMFGWIFGAAHAGVRHQIEHGLQIRDVDGRVSEKREKDIPMIHMGRAWFPKDYEPGWRWHHTEGESFNRFGNQVWCKCNFTASDVIPWPLPEGTDFQSRVTLRLLHDSREYFGDIPDSKFRKKGEHGYHRAFP